ncbi:MAG: hypothetical protein CL885_04470 [Dehalococcoidia bacterium]|nr:hypothetical protein [Dehalococcoidia bacterium]
MKAGDLVKILKRTHWGGIKNIDSRGILVKRVYQAYSEDDNEWEVYIDGKVKRIRGKNLTKVKNSS